VKGAEVINILITFSTPKENFMKPTFRIITIVTLILLLISVSLASAYTSTNPGVLPPNSRVQGLKYEDWLARWWKFTLELPASQNPLTGGSGANCVFQQVGNVALVVANSTMSVPIQCEVPTGIKLYLEVLGCECSTLEEPPFYGKNEEELRACAQSFVPVDLEASIDGVEVQNLEDYIFTSPLYEFTVPEDNILGAQAGSSGKSVGYGVYLMIAPLSPGKHTIHMHGTYPEFEFTADRLFDLTVLR
jgi:hypothetical protein